MIHLNFRFIQYLANLHGLISLIHRTNNRQTCVLLKLFKCVLYWELRLLNMYSFKLCACYGQLICDYFLYVVVFGSYSSHSITFRLVNERLNWTDQNISLSYLNSQVSMVIIISKLGFHIFCEFNRFLFPSKLYLLITLWWELTWDAWIIPPWPLGWSLHWSLIVDIKCQILYQIF